MSRYKYLIDAGHGGVDAQGNYTTDPKLVKRYKFDDGFEILEGVINRKIAAKLYKKLIEANIDFSLVYDEVQDWPLQKRVKLANNIQTKSNKLCIYLSIHSNAGKGKGFEVFTAPGQTRSDVVAEIFCEQYKKHFPNYKLRTDLGDGDLDKEESFYVLKYTMCPAVLVENLFFDERTQAEYLSSDIGQEAIAECMFQSILQTEKISMI